MRLVWLTALTVLAAGCEKTCPAVAPSPFVERLKILPPGAVLCSERLDGLRIHLPGASVDDAQAAFMIGLPKAGWSMSPSSYPHQVRAQYGLGPAACKIVVSFSKKSGTPTAADVAFDACR